MTQFVAKSMILISDRDVCSIHGEVTRGEESLSRFPKDRRNWVSAIGFFTPSVDNSKCFAVHVPLLNMFLFVYAVDLSIRSLVSCTSAQIFGCEWDTGSNTCHIKATSRPRTDIHVYNLIVDVPMVNFAIMLSWSTFSKTSFVAPRCQPQRALLTTSPPQLRLREATPSRWNHPRRAGPSMSATPPTDTAMTPSKNDTGKASRVVVVAVDETEVALSIASGSRH